MSSITSGLYQLEKLPFTSNEFHTKFTNVEGPLSLFDAEDDPDAGNENPDVERPLTPIEEAVKAMPTSFSALAKLMHPRLSPRGYVSEMSGADQQELINVLMNELNSIWSNVKHLPPDPFLTHQQNKELQRRLTIELVVIAQGLFAKYLNKAHKLNKQGVFSDAANMSRLKTQLAVEANKSFNVRSIRRNLSADMKHPSDVSSMSSYYSAGRFHLSSPSKTYRPLVLRHEEEKVKVKTILTKREKEQKHIESELNDLQQQMPTVTAQTFIETLPAEVVHVTRPPSESGSVKSVASLREESAEAGKVHFKEKKSRSIPELRTGENVLVELGIISEEGEDHGLTRTYSVDQLLTRDRIGEERAVTPVQPKPGTAEYAAQDLQRLLVSKSDRLMHAESQGEKDEDLPPLLQALAHHSINRPSRKRASYVNKEMSHKEWQEDIEDGEADNEDDGVSVTSTVISTQASSTALDPRTVEETLTEFTGDEHPQPAVVSLRLPDKTVVRTSDVRVSNRINKNSVTLSRYPTVYNDLTGEIDPPTVKWLDRNLFIGEEIKEVYEEISKTIRTDHLLFDQDSYVERCASVTDVTVATSSSTLAKPHTERVINKDLHRPIPPPWGNGTADNWKNSPKFGGMGREDILQAKLGKVEETGSGQKSYNSWLAWWRSTITTDDYLKFLSTHENDYLSLLFHLYDSDHDSDEEGDGVVRPDTVQMALARQREKKLSEMKSLKTSYQPGVWNVNSILMGGLGNDPDIDDGELVNSLELSHQLPDGQSTTSIKTESDVSRTTVRSRSSARSARSGAITRVTAAQTLGTSEGTASVTHSKTSEAVSLSPQDRLERVWTLLCMPDALRLDMAIKYSADPHRTKLDEALTLWELATELILERESLMTKLEDFERTASDPNRFFEPRGFNGSSSDRIRESKTRNWFDKRLAEGEREMKHIMREIQQQYGDAVTFQGRPYLEKLSVDRTEMLYWLQQERRQQALDRELQPKRMHVIEPELPRLSPYSLL